jgi:hypothetical protein
MLCHYTLMRIGDLVGLKEKDMYRNRKIEKKIVK